MEKMYIIAMNDENTKRIIFLIQEVMQVYKMYYFKTKGERGENCELQTPEIFSNVINEMLKNSPSTFEIEMKKILENLFEHITI